MTRRPEIREDGVRRDYLLRVQRWDWSYSFGLPSKIKIFEDEPSQPFSEAMVITLVCEYVEPKRYAGRALTLKVSSRKDLNGHLEGDWNAKQIGAVESHAAATVSVPQDSYGALVSLLAASQLRYVDLATRQQHHMLEWITQVEFRSYEAECDNA